MPRRNARFVHLLTLATAVGSLAGACQPRSPAVIGPVPDAEGIARGLAEGTGLEEPLWIEFDWHLNDQGQRVNGRGVARVEPPYRARIDLFLDNGETVLRAALVDGDLRLPPGSPDDILPPPDLMWGALGVFRPRPGTRLLGGDRLEGDGTRLRYEYQGGGEIHYRAQDGALRTLEIVDRGSVVQRVEVTDDDGRWPTEATYRNFADFRELTLERDSLAVVTPYDPEIFDPVS